MKNKNSNALMLITGVIAGAATVYFLKSETGKQVVSLVMEKGEELNNKLSQQTNEMANQGKQLVAQAIETGGDVMEKATEQVASVGESIKENVSDTLSDFDKGIDIAKAKLKNA